MRRLASSKRLGILVVFTFLFMFFILPSANAYIDPTTGGLAIQMIVGALAAIGAFFVAFRRRISSFFSRIFGRSRTKV